MPRIVEHYASLDPAFIRLIGAADWLEPRRLLRTVRRVGP
jgi:hypothetical protein